MVGLGQGTTEQCRAGSRTHSHSVGHVNAAHEHAVVSRISRNRGALCLAEHTPRSSLLCFSGRFCNALGSELFSSPGCRFSRSQRRPLSTKTSLYHVGVISIFNGQRNRLQHRRRVTLGFLNRIVEFTPRSASQNHEVKNMARVAHFQFCDQAARVSLCLEVSESSSSC